MQILSKRLRIELYKTFEIIMKMKNNKSTAGLRWQSNLNNKTLLVLTLKLNTEGPDINQLFKINTRNNAKPEDTLSLRVQWISWNRYAKKQLVKYNKHLCKCVQPNRTGPITQCLCSCDYEWQNIFNKQTIVKTIQPVLESGGPRTMARRNLLSSYVFGIIRTTGQEGVPEDCD